MTDKNFEPEDMNLKPERPTGVYTTDIAPPLAAILHIQMANGPVGEVIQEFLK